MDLRLRDALAVLVDRGEIVVPVRTPIAASWKRSLSSGLRPDHFEVPFDPRGERDTLLAAAAAPVLGWLAEDLAETGVGALLTDGQGRVLARWVTQRGLEADLDRIRLAPGFVYAEDATGTNAIGTAAAQRGPAFVDGHEHFADALTRMTCAAAPVVEPRTGRLLGVVDLTARTKDASPLMLSLARQAAREIERRLIDDARDGAALQHLVDRRRREGAVVHEPGDHHGGSGGWDSLSDTEQRVAALVASGLTNRQVGERLFMSRYTVDTHLRSIFRKLGLGSRVELARISATARPAAGTPTGFTRSRDGHRLP